MEWVGRMMPDYQNFRLLFAADNASLDRSMRYLIRVISASFICEPLQF